MTDKTPQQTEGQVLRFRPRGSLLPRGLPRPPPVEDLGRFERTPNQPDDYRHRMKMNGLALAVTVVLVAAGIRIADTMAQMRKNQDCYLAGRPACTQIPPPVPQR